MTWKDMITDKVLSRTRAIPYIHMICNYYRTWRYFLSTCLCGAKFSYELSMMFPSTAAKITPLNESNTAVFKMVCKRL
jgi:hypothetical protein